MIRARRASAFAMAVVLFASASRSYAQHRDECVAAFDRGQAARLQGELRAARAGFVVCASQSCPQLVRKDCAAALAGLDVDMPTMVLGARDTAGHDVIPSAVYVDGQPVSADGRALAYDPGQHVIRFEHPPDAPVTERVVLRVGEHNREILATFPAATPSARAGPSAPSPPMDVSLPSPRATSSARPTAWIAALAGVGALGVGSFVFFGVTGETAKQQLLDTCAPACSDGEVNRVRSRYIAADVSLGVGIVALGVAAYLYFSSASAGAQSARR